jgi:hypothetical protein
VAAAFAVFGIGEVTDQRFGEAILFGFVIALALGAGGLGLRGGLLIGILCSCLAGVWWLQHDQYEGTPWIVSRSAACIVVGVLLGFIMISVGWAAPAPAHKAHPKSKAPGVRYPYQKSHEQFSHLRSNGFGSSFCFRLQPEIGTLSLL